MSFAAAAHFAETWGLVFLVIGFVTASAYALWPRNQEEFNRAARAPLSDGENDVD